MKYRLATAFLSLCASLGCLLTLSMGVPPAEAQQVSAGGMPENAVFAQPGGRRRGGGLFFRGRGGEDAQGEDAGGREGESRRGGSNRSDGEQADQGGGRGRGRGRNRGGNEGGDQQGGRRGRGGRGNPLQSLTSSTDPATQAREVVQRLDQNGDSMLQADELRRSGWLMPADRNRDGVLTIDELQAGLAAGSVGSFGGGRRGGDESGNNEERRGRGGRGRGDNDNDNPNDRNDNERSQENRGRNNNDDGDRQRGGQQTGNPPAEVPLAKTLMSSMTERSYRLKPGKDSLPAEGLPSWFASRDANGDGQVAMHEYAGAWTESLVREFNRYDRNGDGVLTPEEFARRSR
jgi:hypothetical protein